MKYTFQVKEEFNGERVDILLKNRIKNKSRTQIKRNIDEGQLRIDGHVCTKPSYKLKKGEEIEFNIKEKAGSLRYISSRKISLEEVYKDENLLVINKPTGISVHPSPANQQNTLLNGLVYKYRQLLDVGEIPKLGLIHRLDKNTSGVLLVALNDEALWYYSRQFEERQVDKYYLAIVHGNAKSRFDGKKSKVVSTYLGRRGKKIVVVNKQKGKIATSKFVHFGTTQHKKLGTISFVGADIKTGRTHQIRVQLSFMNLPIVGDINYGLKKYREDFTLMLHAKKLKIKMMNGKKKSFETKIPKRMNELFGKERLINIFKENEKYFYQI